MSFLIVGELINTSRKDIKEAVTARDAEAIKKIARNQVQAGAHYIDINCGNFVTEEEQIMEWLVNIVQEVVEDTPLCIDSPNPKALKVGLKLHKKTTKPMINSITAEKERFSQVLPLVLEYNAKVVALLMDDSGIPDTAEKRIAIVDKLLPQLLDEGVPAQDIYFDPLVKPISVSNQAGQEVLQTIQYIKDKYPDVHTICGLSNISYGLPNRRLLNQAFTILTMGSGMDSYILDPTDKQMMSLIYASQALLGLDQFMMNYLKAYRKGLFGS